MRAVIYTFEYFCSTIWKREGEDKVKQEMEVVELEVNDFLKKEIRELDDMYQATYNDEYPPDFLLNDDYREYIFVNRVIISARLLGKELEGRCKFEFDWEEWESEKKRLGK